ncbi:MAG TPA: class I SAM-dependent methyltransferase [Flavisolibacter sp.]|nr:class I SAM-dependent methyltransferase [Flavisolibacter sp.]
MPVQSPVTYTDKTRLIDNFETKEIIALYKAEGIDISRFFEGKSTIALYECEATGYRFFHPQDIFGDDGFYQDLYEKIPGYYHVNRWEHKIAKQLLHKNSSLLEVGCGDGFFLNEAKAICGSVKGLELNTTAIQAARKKGLDVDDTTIQDFAASVPGPYDIVCCFQVLEHIFDIRSFLQSMIRCAKPGGLLIIAVPNNNPYLFKREKKHYLNLPPHHAGLWNERSLTNLSTVFPLEVSQVLYEPLVELKMWYKAQVEFYKREKPLVGKALSLVPRQLYKPVLRSLRHKIQGKTIMIVYKVSAR